MPGKDTEREVTMQGPYVEVRVNEYGRASATFQCYRDKPRGGTEYLTIRFSDLSVHELACIGQQAREAIDRKTRMEWDRGRAQLRRVTGG